MHGLFMIEETENFTRYISAKELSSILKSRGASTQDSPNSKTTHILLGLLDREDRSSMVWTNSKRRKLYVEQEEARRGRAGAAGPPQLIYDHIQFISDAGIKQSVDQATHIARFRPDPTKPKKAPPPSGLQRTRGRIMSATLIYTAAAGEGEEGGPSRE